MRIHPTEQLAHWFIYRLLNGDVSGAPAPSWNGYYGITSYTEKISANWAVQPGVVEREVRCFIANPATNCDVAVATMKIDSHRNEADDWEMRVVGVTYVAEMDCSAPATSRGDNRQINDLSEPFVLFCRSRTRRQLQR